MAQKKANKISAKKLLYKYFSAEQIRVKAKEFGFIKRMRKVEPVSFVLSIIFTTDNADGQSLAGILRHLVLTGVTQLVRSSFWDKLNPQFERLIRSIAFEIQKANKSNPPNYNKGALKGFKDVIAFDCTVITLSKILSQVWPATRQNIASAVKVFTEIRALNGELLNSHIVPERTPDHRFCQVLRWIPGCLYLFDLGFVSGYSWRNIITAKAYFISKMHLSTQPTIIKRYSESISKDCQGKRLKEIVSKYAHQTIDVECEFNVRHPGSNRKDGKVTCRVLGIWNPRTRQHLFYVTNILWLDAKNFGQIYRLRWEVELFYKFGKSGLGLGKIKTSKPYIVRTLIRAALIRSSLALSGKMIAEGFLPVGRWINPQAWAKVVRQFFSPFLFLLNHPSKVFSLEFLARLAMDPNKGRVPLRVRLAT